MITRLKNGHSIYAVGHCWVRLEGKRVSSHLDLEPSTMLTSSMQWLRQGTVCFTTSTTATASQRASATALEDYSALLHR